MEPMQHTLESFLRALRAQEVRVSPAEAIDAHRAAAEVGFADRALLKDALCVTLAKSADEVERFDRCFDTFFSRSASRAARRPASGPAAAPAGAPNLASQLLEGDEAALAQAMEAAAARVGAGEIRLTSQRNLLTRRMLDEMGLRDLEAMIQALRAVGGPRDQALADQLAARRAALFVEAAAFVERQSRLYASETGRRMRDALLAEQKLTAVEPEDFRAMEALVRRMAKRLATKYSRQRHRAHQGKLDVRRTIRRSMGHGGIPFEVVWKTETLNKPKIAVMCDVSRSVASAAQFLLLFLYSLNEVVERLDAFAFSDRLVSVNDLLDDEKVDDAITLVMARVGFRPTDYGRSLADFCDAQGSKLDRRTTVIILGDGRSNYADPRLDLMRTLSQRARSVIWLNPEPETYWGQGDSKMDAYQRFCTVAKPCNTLTQLERIIEDVLRTYTSK
jgi:uncharacterized protein with von Willebrand factor type A (vWA) domain